MNSARVALLCIACLSGWSAPSHAADPAESAAVEDNMQHDDDPQQHSEEIARLKDEIEKMRADYQKRPKRKFISPNETQPEYRDYLDRWTATIERVGNAHDPQDARRLGLTGKVRLMLAIGRDGKIVGMDIIKSSESAILDNAVVDICNLAAPFEPIPGIDDIDVLHIVRTWEFR